MFLMDISQSDDADRLLRDLDMLKDDALAAVDEAVRAPDPALSDLCDALRWTAADGTIPAITAVTGAWTPRGLVLTATVTVATSPSELKVIEHVPLALAQGGPLLEYVSKDPDALTAALVTRWSPGHAPISAARLRHIVLWSLYSAREKAPPTDTDAAPEIQNQKVSFKLQKPISQILPPPPQANVGPPLDGPTAFWALPNDVHAVLQAAQIPTAELNPLKFGLLAWASSIRLLGQFTAAPFASTPPLVNKGMWPPDQLRPLLECSVLPVRSVELLHQIEQAGEHSWATAPTIILLQAGIQDSASPPPPSPLPAMRPTSPRGSRPPAQSGPCLHQLHSPERQRCTAPAKTPLQRALTSLQRRYCPCPRGYPSLSPSPLHRSNRLPLTPHRLSHQSPPLGPPPLAPHSQVSPLSRTWTCRPTPPTMPNCVTGTMPSSRSCALRKMT